MSTAGKPETTERWPRLIAWAAVALFCAAFWGVVAWGVWKLVN